MRLVDVQRAVAFKEQNVPGTPLSGVVFLEASSMAERLIDTDGHPSVLGGDFIQSEVLDVQSTQRVNLRNAEHRFIRRSDRREGSHADDDRATALSFLDDLHGRASVGDSIHDDHDLLAANRLLISTTFSAVGVLCDFVSPYGNRIATSQVGVDGAVLDQSDVTCRRTDEALDLVEEWSDELIGQISHDVEVREDDLAIHIAREELPCS